MARGLQPLLKWPGGKSRTAKRLAAMFPKHSTYVEPFAGGAAVFFRKPLVQRNVLSDHDKWLMDFYKSARRGGIRKCWGGIKPSEDLFRRSKKNNSVCHKIALSALSFHGDKATFGPGSVGGKGGVAYTAKLKHYKDYEAKLGKAWLVQGDFAQTMRRFDGRNTVHFLDPPWPLKYSDDYYAGGVTSRRKSLTGKKIAGTAFDPAHVKKVAQSMQGYVLIIINDSKALRRMYCHKPFKCSTIKVATNIGRRNVLKSNLIIVKPARRS